MESHVEGTERYVTVDMKEEKCLIIRKYKNNSNILYSEKEFT